ncbi:unnamed protein product [Closterium sp. Naga37s-1]|nr:unnamed protein product [Closterium sp. Naga37s-1]
MYTKEELSAATNNFKHKLGEGGFGAVYKGFLKVESGAEAAESLGVDLSAVSEGEIPVAVKMCAAKLMVRAAESGRECWWEGEEIPVAVKMCAAERARTAHGEGFWAPHGMRVRPERTVLSSWFVVGVLGVLGGGEIPVALKMRTAKVLSAREQLMVRGKGHLATPVAAESVPRGRGDSCDR